MTHTRLSVSYKHNRSKLRTELSLDCCWTFAKERDIVEND